MNKGNSIRNTFNKIVKEARMRWQPGGTWKRTSYVSPLELGQVKYHFLDTKNPDKHVGQSAMTRALANLHVDKGDPNNPKAAIIGHPFAGDLKHLHQLAKHHERRMMDAQMHLNKDPLAIKGRFKNDAHARSSFNKWSNHLHTLHSDVMRGLLDAQAKGHPLPEGFEGLTPQHVENHAKIKGIDISQPFDSKSFNEKVRGFGRHNTLDGSINHPLYQGWKTPPAPPTNPTPQVESNTMSKSQRIRAIFESKLAEAKDVVGSAENIVKLSELPHSEKDKKLRAAWKKTAQETMLKGIKDREAAAEAKLSGEVAAEKGARNTPGGKLPKPENSSTNYYRAGLRALFESVLDEAQDPKKLQKLQNKRLKPMTSWGATIPVLPKAKTRSQRKVDKNLRKFRAKETDYPDPQDP